MHQEEEEGEEEAKETLIKSSVLIAMYFEGVGVAGDIKRKQHAVDYLGACG